ncbi:hypothetical protein LQW54_005087 [Pestalotiopsis sp. IQ-011]
MSGNNGAVSSITVKLATIDDLDDLTRIAQAGFPDDPEFDYRFPYRKQFPDDNWDWTKQEYKEYLKQPNKYSVLLATLPPIEEEDKREQKLERSRPISVALAVWDVQVNTASLGGGLSSFPGPCGSLLVFYH